MFHAPRTLGDAVYCRHAGKGLLFARQNTGRHIHKTRVDEDRVKCEPERFGNGCAVLDVRPQIEMDQKAKQDADALFGLLDGVAQVCYDYFVKREKTI